MRLRSGSAYKGGLPENSEQSADQSKEVADKLVTENIAEQAVKAPHNNANHHRDQRNQQEPAAQFGEMGNSVNPNANQHPHHPPPSSSNRENLKSHNKWVVLLLQVAGWAAVLFFFVIPAFIRLNPWVMHESVFLSHISWPPFINLSNPQQFGLNATRHLRVPVNNDINLGAWHVLPKSLQQDNPTEEDFKSSFKTGKPVIIYMHGNAGTRGGWHRVQLYKILANNDYHVIPFDYRGFGDSPGYPSEDGCVEDVLAVYQWMHDHHPSNPVYLWGHSLGSAIATKVAKAMSDRGEPPAGLILEAPFNNILDAAMNHPFSRPFTFLPWFTWAFIEGIKQNGIMMETDKNILDVTAPTLILHAEDDGIVPYQLGYMLYEVAKTNKQHGGVQFQRFDGDHGYGHKHIHKSPELPLVISEFVRQTK